ncbi:hypothetical protein DW261_05865 [Fusobacterium varium]|nr:hypothetical protein DW261_05865 [Fusobacterium varium]
MTEHSDITNKNFKKNIESSTVKLPLFSLSSSKENPSDEEIKNTNSIIKDVIDENVKDSEEVDISSIDKQTSVESISNNETIVDNYSNDNISNSENIIEDYSNDNISNNENIVEDYSDDIISNNENIVEDINKFQDVENTEPRHIIISTDNPSFESGLEIKYTSLQLRNFPIRYKNFSEKIDFDEIVNIGTTSIKIGNTTIHNASLKILVYSKFKLLEIKTREFKLALSIELNDKQTLVKKDDYFKYDIYDKVKTSRLKEVVELFKKIFAGESITFKYNQLMGDIIFENRLEVYKFTIISESINSYNYITKELELYKEKNINNVKDDFYSLFLLNAHLKNEKLSNWVNFRIKNNYNILPGDILSFEKIHKLHLHGINFDLKEHVKLIEPISPREINEKNEICCYRKAVEITLEKIKKI